MRRLVCDAIKAMILLLDDIDGDVDPKDDDPAEENGDLERSLGAFELMNQGAAWQTNDHGGGGMDLELDDADKEPSLGSLGNIDQTEWAGGGANDLRYEHDGREPDADAESYVDDESDEPPTMG